MPSRDEHDAMDLEVDPVLMERLFLLGALLFFAMAILGLVGEVLGWWNDTGELLVSIGTIGGLVLTTGFGFASAGRRQVSTVHDAVLDNGKTLVSVDGKLDKLDGLDRVQVQLDQQTGVLEDIRDLL